MSHRLIEHARTVIGEHLAGRNWRAQWKDPPTRPSKGCFVSLKLNARLRGCIGTVEPVRPTLEEEVALNALAAALRDPRFSPLNLEELGQVRISIDLLNPPEPVVSPDELDPARYGLVVKSGRRSGVLLPEIPGVTTVDRQIEICLDKAGIDPKAPCQLSRFTVTRIEE